MKRIALACLLLGMPLASAASAQDVIFRDGFELVCPPDMGDCDGNPADCETSLRTLTDCGACGVPCAMEHGTCASGTCEACPAGSGECDGDGATSCETALDTVLDCGDCDVTCTNDHGSTSCAAANCAPQCDSLWRSCDFDAANGCERSVNTLSDCGDCNAACNLPNASEACNAGLCELGTCDTGFGNCDADPVDGCEQPLTTLTHCGTCNQPCDLANASESCGSQTCVLTSCDSGFSNCDGSVSSGCEVQHSGYSNSPPGENLGTYDADSSSGFPLCAGQGCEFLLTRTGRRGKYFTITASEDSTCTAYISLRLELVVPTGVNYDFFVTGGGFLCDPDCSGTGPGTTEIVVYANDDPGSDDSFTAAIEVRHSGGASCQFWALNVYRRGC